MAEPLRHRQTKEAATDMFDLQPPRHISTLPNVSFCPSVSHFRSTPRPDIPRPRPGRVRFVPGAVALKLG